ncbi:MAG: polysaccharide pyruvyl transferase family protein [Chlorobium sp.]|nr:polysaccharide pyruvyl transferase family protein [Chlorobium sp.]
MKLPNNNIKNILVLGANFDTGNLGVSALASSIIFLIRQHWPEAHVCLLGGREFKTGQTVINELPVNIEMYPVRYCSNLLAPNHIWKLLLGVFFRKLTKYQRQETKKKNIPFNAQFPVTRKKETLEALLNVDVICDITGGDSFSDIYGLGRFLRGYLLKRTCQITGKPYIMLPQTYGPFKSLLSRWMAKRVLQKAHTIYSRDREGLNVIEDLIGKSEKVRLCPDVAFTLASRIPTSTLNLFIPSGQEIDTEKSKPKAGNSQLIGLNVSGLLYNGGYTGKNEFGVKDDYKKLMRKIIDFFVSIEDTSILLVPHVVPENWETENDLIACQKLQETFPENIKERILIAEPGQGQPFYDQCEIKYLIGKCSFFLGSRMHATIAAISQCIPTIGLAYSKKFAGVYETAGVENCVADLRTLTNKEIMDIIMVSYAVKESIKLDLERKIPETKKQVYSIFEGI